MGNEEETYGHRWARHWLNELDTVSALELAMTVALGFLRDNLPDQAEQFLSAVIWELAHGGNE